MADTLNLEIEPLDELEAQTRLRHLRNAVEQRINSLKAHRPRGLNSVRTQDQEVGDVEITSLEDFHAQITDLLEA